MLFLWANVFPMGSLNDLCYARTRWGLFSPVIFIQMPLAYWLMISRPRGTFTLVPERFRCAVISMPLHWPGHKYLGPGTDLSKEEEPIDADDYVARIHDIEYTHADTAEKVYEADQKAIKAFTDIVKTSSSSSERLHSRVAAAALSAKYSVEKYVIGRPLYGMAGVKRPAEGVEEPAAKLAKGEKGHHGVISSGTGGSERDIQISRSNEALAFGRALIIKKSWILSTWGFRSAVHKHANHFHIRSPLAYIPVDSLPFYMSPSEYEQLPAGATAKQCFVKVTGKGQRCMFEAGSSTAQSVNSESTVFGISASGLNKKYNFALCRYSGKAGDPTTVDVTKIDEMDWPSWFYSKDTSKLAAATPWVFRRLPIYAIFPTGVSTHADYNPALNNDCNVFDLRTAQGIPVLNYEYEFVTAPLKLRQTLPNFAMNTESYANMKKTDFSITTRDYLGHIATTSDGAQRNNLELKYNHRIEKSDWISFGLKPQYSTLPQPDLYIGVIPPVCTSPFASTQKFQQVMAYWQVDTTLVVDFNFSSSSLHVPTMAAYKSAYWPRNMWEKYPVASADYCFNDGQIQMRSATKKNNIPEIHTSDAASEQTVVFQTIAD